jgi:hypothetical protein
MKYRFYTMCVYMIINLVFRREWWRNRQGGERSEEREREGVVRQ